MHHRSEGVGGYTFRNYGQQAAEPASARRGPGPGVTFSRDDDNPARMPDRAPDRAPEKNPDRPRKTGLGCGVYALFAYAIIVFTSICDSVSSQGAPGIYGPVGQPAAGVISVALMLVYVRLSPRIDILGFLGKSKVSEAKK